VDIEGLIWSLSLWKRSQCTPVSSLGTRGDRCRPGCRSPVERPWWYQNSARSRRQVPGGNWWFSCCL